MTLYTTSLQLIIDLLPRHRSTRNLRYTSLSSISMNARSRYYIWHYKQIFGTFQTQKFFQRRMSSRKCYTRMALRFSTLFVLDIRDAYMCRLTNPSYQKCIPLLFIPLTPLDPVQVKIWQSTNILQGPSVPHYSMQQNDTYQSSEPRQYSSWHFVSKYAEILSSMMFKMGDAPANKLLQIGRSDHFDINHLKNTVKHANNCEEVVPRDEKKVLIKNVSQMCMPLKDIGPITGLVVH